MKKTTASLTLQINKWVAAILLSICLIAAILDLLFWKIELIQLLLTYSAIILIVCGVPYMPIPILQILIQLIGNLLQLNYFPAFLQKHTFTASCIIAIGTLLLWLPILPFGVVSLNQNFILTLVLLLLCWILFFRALDFAEQRQFVLSNSLQEQEQQQIQFWAIWLIILGIACLGCLLPLASFIGALLFGQSFFWNQRQQFFLIISATILIFTLLLGLLYRHNTKRIRATLETLQLQHQLEQNQLYIDLLTQKYHTLRQYQHDFKKHLAYIQQLARQNETSMIDSYIGAVYDDLQSGSLLKLTGNQTLDLLLSDKLQQAQKQNIAFEIEYQPNVKLSCILALDLCVILGNLLDNAITAAAQSAEQKIFCGFQQKSQYYRAIIVSNSCDIAPVMKNGIPQRPTSAEQCGYGIQNVLNRVQKYGGHCQFCYDTAQKQFQVTVLLSCTKE